MMRQQMLPNGMVVPQFCHPAVSPYPWANTQQFPLFASDQMDQVPVCYTCPIPPQLKMYPHHQGPNAETTYC